MVFIGEKQKILRRNCKQFARDFTYQSTYHPPTNFYLKRAYLTIPCNSVVNYARTTFVENSSQICYGDARNTCPQQIPCHFPQFPRKFVTTAPIANLRRLYVNCIVPRNILAILLQICEGTFLLQISIAKRLFSCSGSLRYVHHHLSHNC